MAAGLNRVESRPMNITLNGTARSFNEPATLTQLIKELGIENRRLAIEVNQVIVPRGQYDDFQLKEQDEVEVVQAIGGGQTPVQLPGNRN